MTRFTVAALAFGVLAAAGCDGRPGCHVFGTVTRAGRPIVPGSSIRFEPDGGAGGPTATAPIQDGRYDIPSGVRLAPGKYVVRIFPPLIAGDESIAPETFPMVTASADLADGDSQRDFEVPAPAKARK